ncbi:MAG: BtpA/SgcQ family protein [Cyanobacteria bacterium J06641_5]
MDLQQVFQTPSPIIGVVHLLPLPGSPQWGGDLAAAIARAEQEAAALAAGGVDGLVIENFHDAPFAKDCVDPAVVSAMTAIARQIMNLVPLPVGINVLRNDAKSALAIAACTGAQFIRVNVLTGVMATDQGLIEGKAHEVMRYRRELGQETLVFADVLVKHAVPLGMPTLAGVVRDTLERGLADGIIISGTATGDPPSLEDLKTARAAAGERPILIGSGANWGNIGDLLAIADGAIVASSLKRDGRLGEPIDPVRTSQFVDAARRARATSDASRPVTSSV